MIKMIIAKTRVTKVFFKHRLSSFSIFTAGINHTPKKYLQLHHCRQEQFFGAVYKGPATNLHAKACGATQQNRY